MARAVRKFFGILLIAVLACGNPLSAIADAVEHVGAEFSHASSQNAGSHKHRHDHSQTSGMVDIAGSGLAANDCYAGACHPEDQPGEPCCHVHAHCCVSSGYLPSQGLPYQQRVVIATRMAFAREALPLGAIVYPLLRPPRSTG